MRILLFILFLPIIFSSCDDEFEIPDYYSGSVSAEMNGVSWTALIHGVNSENNKFDIQISNFDSDNLKEETLDIIRIPKEIGSYTLSTIFTEDIGVCLYTTLTADGDVTCDTYYLVNTPEFNSVLNVTRFENDGQNIEGNFELTFYHIRPDDKCNENAPDTLKFRNGVFQTKITR